MAFGGRAETTGNVELALAKVLNNICEHAYRGRDDGRIEIGLRGVPDGIAVEIGDHGRPMPAGRMACAPNPHPQPGIRHAGSTTLGGELPPRFDEGRGGVEGWPILDVPEAHAAPAGDARGCRGFPKRPGSGPHRSGSARWLRRWARGVDVTDARRAHATLSAAFGCAADPAAGTAAAFAMGDGARGLLAAERAVPRGAAAFPSSVRGGG
jgi:hypothetical protein